MSQVVDVMQLTISNAASASSTVASVGSVGSSTVSTVIRQISVDIAMSSFVPQSTIFFTLKSVESFLLGQVMLTFQVLANARGTANIRMPTG